MTLIILEGPRGIGKSTVAYELRNLFMKTVNDVSVWKVQRGLDPIADQLHAIAYDFNAALSSRNCVVIVDRFHMTELVMTQYYKRRNFADALRDFELVDRLLRLVGAYGFCLTADCDTLAARIGQRADGRGLDMPIEDSFALWTEIAKQSHFLTIQNYSIEKTISTIMEDYK